MSSTYNFYNSDDGKKPTPSSKSGSGSTYNIGIPKGATIGAIGTGAKGVLYVNQYTSKPPQKKDAPSPAPNVKKDNHNNQGSGAIGAIGAGAKGWVNGKPSQLN